MSKTTSIGSLINQFKIKKEAYFEFLDSQKDIVNLLASGLEPDYESETMKSYFASVEVFRNEMSDFIKQIHKQSIKQDYYFFDCSLSVYKQTLKTRVDTFIAKNSEATPIDFYQVELYSFKFAVQHRKFYIKPNESIDYSVFVGNNTVNFGFSLRQKRNYLKSLMKGIQKPFIKTNQAINGIFIDAIQENLFYCLVNDLLIDLSNINRRGNQAKFMAIWETATSKKTMFKSITSLKEYVDFLNLTYFTDYKSKSVSSGYNYQKEVSNLIKLHQEN